MCNGIHRPLLNRSLLAVSPRALNNWKASAECLELVKMPKAGPQMIVVGSLRLSQHAYSPIKAHGVNLFLNLVIDIEFFVLVLNGEGVSTINGSL